MSDKKLRWGVIGCGGIADRRTIPGMMLSKTSVLVAVMDTNFELAKKVQEKYGAKYAFDNYDELLALDEVDAVYIASPVFCHKEQAFAAFKAKKHVLLEKPLGLTADDSLEIIEAAEKAGVKLGTGFMMRFNPFHREIKRIIAEGKIGDIVSMRAQFSCWYPEIPGAWRQTKALSGGGALIDLGVHCIDLLLFISGLEAVECTGYASTNTFSYEVDDSASLIIKMSNGANAYVDVNFNVPDAAAKSPLEFYGTRGSIFATGTLSQSAGGGKVDILYAEEADYDAAQNRSLVKPMKLEVEPVNLYTEEIDAFATAVLEDKEPPVNGRNTLSVQRIIDAIYKSNGGKIQ